MKRLDIIKFNNLYIRIFNIVLKIGIDNLIINFGNFTISFRPKKITEYDFELIFWLNENRISFNIEDWYEVLDSYLTDEKEAIEVFEFIDTIFKNEVLIENYCLENSSKLYKRNLVFTAKINNIIQKVSNEKKLFFKLPWVKEKLNTTNKFKPLY